MAKQPDDALAVAVARLARAIEEGTLRHDREERRGRTEQLVRQLELERSGEPETLAALNGERPAPLNIITSFMRAAPGMYDQFTLVPRKRRFFTTHDHEALVRCPCGGRPRVGAGQMERCPGDCGRVYVFAGRGRLLVAKADYSEYETEATNSD